MLYKSYIAVLYVRDMHKNIEKATYITVAAILASMVLVPSTIFYYLILAQAQGTPLVPKANQSMSGMKMSGMKMAAPVYIHTESDYYERFCYCSSRR